MNAPHRFIFEQYKGPATRYACPQCGKRKEFTRYVDTDTGELLPEHVGKCNRADACGYHYPPRDYFRDNGIRPDGDGTTSAPKPEPPPLPPFLHDRAEVAATRQHPERNTLSAYWRERIDAFCGAGRWDEVAKDYALGTWQSGRLAGAAVFWHVDHLGRVKAGKVMLYNPETGKRRKDVRHTSFVHFEHTGKNTAELNVEQCLFGDHLLKTWPMDKAVAVVESERTAMIAAALMPAYCWVATGSLGEFKLAKLQALTGRKVLAFPDLSIGSTAYYAWKERAAELKALFASIHVSDLLDAGATVESTLAGMDIADLLLRENPTISVALPADIMETPPQLSVAVRAGARDGHGTSPPAPILSATEVAVGKMAERNPAINKLIEVLGLELAKAKISRIANQTQPATA
jgi:hypothetical protein